MPLECENALRGAEAAESPMRRRIRGHGAAANANVRAVIRPRSMNCPARQDNRRKRLVRTAVDRKINIHRDKLAVARDPCAMPRPRGMALGRRNHIFCAVANLVNVAFFYLEGCKDIVLAPNNFSLR